MREVSLCHTILNLVVIRLLVTVAFTLICFSFAEVFELHMEELRAKQEEISKRDNEIKLLEAIIQTLGGRESLK